MIVLYIVACLQAGACEHVSLGYQFDTPMACLMASQPAAAEWARWHPKFKIIKVRCEHPGKEA